MKVVAVVIVINMGFVLWRCWAGGMFETGLEWAFRWRKADENVHGE